MRDFSIDLNAQKIYSSKSREYFEEVLRSYYNESYRSAVVMLYSIVVADLIYKLQELKELYNDNAAITILDEIETMQSRNPKNPDWESKLIELVNSKTNLLEPSDYLHLTTLREHRHLCAHPVLTLNFELYQPNRETTRAHIRNILEGVLTKPALLSRKIFDDFMRDLQQIKTSIARVEEQESFIQKKYFDKLNLATKQKFFRSLWKITFKVDSIEANANRKINLLALNLLLRKSYESIRKLIADDSDFFSQVDERYFKQLFTLINNYQEIFTLFSDATKILIRNKVSKDIDLEVASIFLSDNVNGHIEKIKGANYDSWNTQYQWNEVYPDSILMVYEHCLKLGERKLGHKFLIEMFGLSNNFNNADWRFNELIEPHIKQFDIEELELILQQIQNNYQIKERREAPRTNTIIKKRILEIEPDFSFENYSLEFYP